ncbi:Ger(x)C family spore germination protein [Metabacillus arenae]|uniref:Ger(X)C family spore germination protein n=1 Tax=Metabacillus arenae TaxID=2771434 RepID=A0A926RZ19_9BACI|nr:Ger(x)C family spore germination protein [Metabacillus arenae]MBD1381767.1 Ger(x)C family spore germination protein [Metabacillus arenae]
MKLRPFIMLILILSIVLLSGCWDRKELQDIDLVSAIGIDDGGDDVENRYSVTVQVINEGQIAGGQQQGGKGEISPVTTNTSTGSTVQESLRKIAPKLPQELFFPHVQLMVIGEKLAREKGIQDLFDWLERNSEFRTLFPILVVRGDTAKSALEIMTALEPIPSAKIIGGLESTQKTWGEYASSRADQVIQQLGGEAAHLTGVEIIGNPEQGEKLTNVQQINPQAELQIRGLAIFKKGKLKKWLDEDAARGANWVNNELAKTSLNLDCKEKKKGVAVDMMRTKTKIKATIKNKKPVIHVSIRSEAHISEVHCPIDLGKYTFFEKLEKQLEKEIKEEVKMAVEAAKEEESDIFRFGEYVNREDPKLWKEMKKKWNDEVFPETEVKVDVLAFIRRSGLRTKPYIK